MDERPDYKVDRSRVLFMTREMLLLTRGGCTRRITATKQTYVEINKQRWDYETKIKIQRTTHYQRRVLVTNVCWV